MDNKTVFLFIPPHLGTDEDYYRERERARWLVLYVLNVTNK
jgi:hypothetical protein